MSPENLLHTTFMRTSHVDVTWTNTRDVTSVDLSDMKIYFFAYPYAIQYPRIGCWLIALITLVPPISDMHWHKAKGFKRAKGDSAKIQFLIWTWLNIITFVLQNRAITEWCISPHDAISVYPTHTVRAYLCVRACRSSQHRKYQFICLYTVSFMPLLSHWAFTCFHAYIQTHWKKNNNHKQQLCACLFSSRFRAIALSVQRLLLLFLNI